MALITIKNGHKITVPNNVNNEVQLDPSVQKPGALSTWWIEVIAGSIQFAADEAVTADHHVWGAGSKIPMTIQSKLNYRGQTGAGESFVVTV